PLLARRHLAGTRRVAGLPGPPRRGRRAAGRGPRDLRAPASETVAGTGRYSRGPRRGDRVTCATCGAENEAGRKFCGECGSALARACAACGTPNPPTVKFCGECGSPLTAQVAPSAAAPRQTAPESERRLVSVL